MIETSWLSSRDIRILLHPCEGVKSREHAEGGKDQEGYAVPFKSFSAVELHENIIKNITEQVTDEDRKEDGWQFFWIRNGTENAEGKVGQENESDEDCPGMEIN